MVMIITRISIFMIIFLFVKFGAVCVSIRWQDPNKTNKQPLLLISFIHPNNNNIWNTTQSTKIETNDAAGRCYNQGEENREKQKTNLINGHNWNLFGDSRTKKNDDENDIDLKRKKKCNLQIFLSKVNVFGRKNKNKIKKWQEKWKKMLSILCSMADTNLLFSLAGLFYLPLIACLVECCLLLVEWMMMIFGEKQQQQKHC